MPKTKNITLSLPEEIVEYLEAEAKKSYVKEQKIKEKRIIDTYKTGKYSFAKIAKLTGSSVPEVLDILAKYEIKEEVSEEELKEGKKILESLLNN